MANRHWTDNKQRSVSSKGHGPAYMRDGGKVLNDTETQPPYPANIGPDSPDLNKVGFPTVKAFVKARFMLFGRPEGVEGPLHASGAFTSRDDATLKAIGGIGEALGKAGGSMNTGSEGEGPKVYEPGRNSGSAPVETRFPGRVVRRGER